eukprot:NODE_391_length_2309_cov_32.481416_g362_i0.p1 GENE.NODE_391_length_2309_cov_32.481416_g362_i0~~NODE_391_length_2309_cov_32.481416_g362_i0.p1  ORF type:complete len:412 (-),score=36.24 NODE_391_length_2309_cov_32.481416_g362_i0:298-1533(-)
MIQLVLNNNRLTGSVDLTSLPAGMTHLLLHTNQLSGSLDLTSLPTTIKQLLISTNQLTGSVDLTQLPAGMTHLWLSENQLTGSVDLTSLPVAMTNIYLHFNQLTGSVDLTSLPGGMIQLLLSNNRLTGSVDLTGLPAPMIHLFLHVNQLTGSVDLTRLPAAMTHLWISDNQLTGSVDLTSLPGTLTQLLLDDNRFASFLNLSGVALPAGLTTFRLGGSNRWICPAPEHPQLTDIPQCYTVTMSSTLSDTGSETRTPTNPLVLVMYYPAPRHGAVVQLLTVRGPYQVGWSKSSSCDVIGGSAVSGSTSTPMVLHGLKHGAFVCVSSNGEPYQLPRTHACMTGEDPIVCAQTHRVMPARLRLCNRIAEDLPGQQMCWCFEGASGIFCRNGYTEPWGAEEPTSIAEWEEAQARL